LEKENDGCNDDAGDPTSTDAAVASVAATVKVIVQPQ
jgi:hypothetical protein